MPVTSSVLYLYLACAQDLGYLKQAGLTLNRVVMPLPTEVAALHSGSVQFLAPVGSAARAAETHGFPFRVVDVAENSAPFWLVGAKGTRSVADLRGKVVGLDAPDSTLGDTAVALLRMDGLPPGSYQVTYLGENPAGAMAAVKTDRVSAAIVPPEAMLAMKAQGFPVLDGGAGKISMPLNGLATTLSIIRTKPGLVRAMVGAVIQGTRACASNENQAVSVLVHDDHDTPAEARQLFTSLKNVWLLDGRPSPALMRAGFAFDKQDLHLKRTPTAASIYDLSFLP